MPNQEGDKLEELIPRIDPAAIGSPLANSTEEGPLY